MMQKLILGSLLYEICMAFQWRNDILNSYYAIYEASAVIFTIVEITYCFSCHLSVNG